MATSRRRTIGALAGVKFCFSQRPVGHESSRPPKFFSRFGKLLNRGPQAASPEHRSPRAEDAEEDQALNFDDPEGRRIAAALLRTTPCFRPIARSSPAFEVSETTEGGEHDASPRDMDGGGCSTATTRSHFQKHGRTVSLKSDSNDDDDALSQNDVQATRTEKPSGSQSAMSHVGTPPEGAVMKGMFWQELDGLREENASLRVESEIERLRGRTATIKLELQEFLSGLLYRTAFGCRGDQIDAAIVEMITDATSAVTRCLRDTVDIPAILLQYHIPADLSVVTESTTTPPPASSLSAKALRQQTFVPRKSASPPPRLQLPVVSQSVYSSPSGPPVAAYTYILAATSRAFLWMAGRASQPTGSEWKSIYEARVPDDVTNMCRLRLWMDAIKEKYHNIQRYSEEQYEHHQHPAGIPPPVAEDLLVRVSLRRTEQGTQAPCGALFLPLVVANYLYLIGVHRPRSNDNGSIMEEIALRRDMLKILDRIAQRISDVLRVAMGLLDQHDLSRSEELYGRNNSSVL